MKLCSCDMMNQKKYSEITRSDFSYDIKISKGRYGTSRLLRIYDNGSLLTTYSLASNEMNEEPEVEELLKKLEEFKTGG